MMHGTENEVIDSRFLQKCDIPLDTLRVEPFTLMIFGGNGDLSRKKLMPAIFRLWRDGDLPKHFLSSDLEGGMSLTANFAPA